MPRCAIMIVGDMFTEPWGDERELTQYVKCVQNFKPFIYQVNGVSQYLNVKTYDPRQNMFIAQISSFCRSLN